MRIFLTGASGVLGRSLIPELVRRGHTVTGAVRSEATAQLVRQAGGTPVTVDLFDVEALTRAMEGAEVVVHGATKVPTTLRPRPGDLALNDALRREGTLALAMAAGRAGASRYVQQSVVWAVRPVYGEPFDETSVARATSGPYASALEGEQIAEDAIARYPGVSLVQLRCASFYGPLAGHTQLARDALLAKRPVLLGGGRVLWSMLHHDDAAQAFALACEGTATGTYHVTDNAPVPVATYMAELARLLNAPAPRSLPLWLARWVLPDAVVGMFARSTETFNTRFAKAFGFAPRYPSYREGLSQTVSAWTGG